MQNHRFQLLQTRRLVVFAGGLFIGAVGCESSETCSSALFDYGGTKAGAIWFTVVSDDGGRSLVQPPTTGSLSAPSRPPRPRRIEQKSSRRTRIPPSRSLGGRDPKCSGAHLRSALHVLSLTNFWGWLRTLVELVGQVTVHVNAY